jgi:hypothetical protein
MGAVLPCCYCRESYQKFIRSEPTTLHYGTMDGRHTLTRWLYNVHKRVNEKLGIKYLFTYQDLEAKYESFRAKCIQDEHEKGCTAPLDWKTFSFLRAESKDAPVISIDTARRFVPLADWYGIPTKHQLIRNWDDLDECKDDRILWSARNALGTDLIRKMRESGVPSLITESETSRPTAMETRLIMIASSNLPESELIEIADKLGYPRFR